MYLGKIVEMAPSEALWQRPLHPYSAGLIGAITEPDGEGRLPADLPGDVPDPAAPPPGCRFHPRCPIAIERCSVEEPAWQPLAPGRTVACHRAEAALT